MNKSLRRYMASAIAGEVKTEIDRSDEKYGDFHSLHEALPDAIEGQDGHGTLLCVANAIFWGFGLEEQNGWPILCEYNQRCKPPWADWELRHKVNEAQNKPPPGKDFCWLLNANRKKYELGDFNYSSLQKNCNIDLDAFCRIRVEHRHDRYCNLLHI